MFGNGRQCAADDDLDGIPNTLLTIGCDNPPCPLVSHMTVTSCHMILMRLKESVDVCKINAAVQV
jgi:hypothetical protein